MMVTIQSSVSKILREATGIRIISNDKLEGIDSQRPCFTVDTTLINSSPVTHYYSDTLVRIEIDYYGNSDLELKQMLGKLNRIFSLSIKVGENFFLLEDKSSSFFSSNILEFSFFIRFREIIQDNPYVEITNPDHLNGGEPLQMIEDVNFKKGVK